MPIPILVRKPDPMVLFAARSSAPPFLLSHDGAERVDWGTRVTKKGAPGTTERTPRPKRETEMDYAAPISS
jgi:hypothetical protein